MAAPMEAYSLISMDPHTRFRDDIPGRPRESVSHRFRCLQRTGKSRMLVCVVVTAYNEPWHDADGGDIRSTIHGVMDNLSTLHNYNVPVTEGGPLPSHRIARASTGMFDGAASESRLSLPATSSEMVALAPCAALRPDDVLILVVLDGRTKISDTLFGGPGSGCPLAPTDKDRMEAAVAALPVKPDDRPDSSAVRDLHLFEGEYNAAVRPGEAFPVHANIAFAIKERNGGKLNSHVWAFRGLLPLLNPRYVVLLDAGTVPAPTAILRLFADMEYDADIGGCCGEIMVDRCQLSLGNPVVMAQHFEYTMANLLDKSFESVMGYIGVLPGAFSAYRWRAIQGAPLHAYFKLEDKDAVANLSASTANMYLAEDRILGFEIVAKSRERWRLYYDHAAQAATDVPDTVGKLVKQRRRWLNGSFFATVYSVSNWARMMKGNRHSIAQRALFGALFLWNVLNMFLAWFSIGNAYIVVTIVFSLSGSLSDLSHKNVAAPLCANTVTVSRAVAVAYTVLVWLFELMQAALLVWSLGNRPDESELLWNCMAYGLGVFTLGTQGVMMWSIPKFSPQLLFTAIGTLSTFVVTAFIQGRLLQIIAAVPFYILMMPLFIILIPIYSYCNTNDVSWGNRPGGAHAVSADVAAQDRRFRSFRSMLVVVWLGSNWILSQGLQTLGQSTTRTFFGFSAIQLYGLAFVVLGGMTLIMRVIGCVLYVLTRAWMFSHLVPSSCRRCLCCRAPAVGSDSTPRTPGRTPRHILQSASGAVSPTGFRVDGETVYNNPMRTGPDPLSPRMGAFALPSPSEGTRPAPTMASRGNALAATQVVVPAQLSHTVDGASASAPVSNLSSAFDFASTEEVAARTGPPINSSAGPSSGCEVSARPP